MSEFAKLMDIMKIMEEDGDYSLLESIPESQMKAKEELNRLTQIFNSTPKKAKTKCMFPGCTVRAINSHSIQKALLTTIADGTNHVTRITLDVGFNPNGGIAPKAEPISIHKASTFAGYCNPHDSEIFGPIENGEIDPKNHEHHFLLTLRAIAREYSEQNTNYFQMRKLSDKILPTLENENVMIPYMAINMYKKYLELHHISNMQKLADHVYQEKCFSKYFDYGYIQIDRELPVFVNTFTVIQGTNDGTEYRRDLRKEKPLYLSLTVLKGDGVTKVFYAVLKKQREEMDSFLGQITTSDKRQQEDFLTDTILRNSDNFYMASKYWEDIPAKAKSELMNIFYITIANRKRIVKTVNLFEYI